MIKTIRHIWMLTFFALNIACQEESESEANIWQYSPPRYKNVAIECGSDTLHFNLQDSTLKHIGTINIFKDHGIDYIALYDFTEMFINIYHFQSQKLVKKVFLKNYLSDARPYLTSTHCKKFDSIFVSVKNKTLYLLDTSGRIKTSMDFPDQSKSEVGTFENARPLVLKDKYLYTGVCPTYKVSYTNGLKHWKLIYGFNLQNSKTAMYYHLPHRYRTQLYDYHFYNYGYCINDRGNLVFSFPADSNVYETDFIKINIAYNGRSRFQQGDIEPENAKDLKNGGSTIQFRSRDSYGPIFYDPFRKRYLRLFMQKINTNEVTVKSDRKQSVLVFNESLQIIGESHLPDGISFSSLFFMDDGKIYVRTKAKDKSALHFVQLNYHEKDTESLAVGEKKHQ